MRVRCKFSSITPPVDPCSSYTWGEVEDYTIVILAAIDCEGMPSAGAATASAISVCPDISFTVSIPSVPELGITYQWQSSTDGVSYAEIPGATSTSYTTTHAVGTWYRAVVTCVPSGMSSTSSAVFVNAICPGCTNPDAFNYNPFAGIDDGTCILPYSIETCDYGSLLAVPGGATSICLSDDSWSTAVAMGFTFPFYNLSFSNIYIGSNGLLSFNSGLASACCSGQFLPSASYPNSIFFAQEDLNPASCGSGFIRYWTEGSVGSQIFVVDFNGVQHFGGGNHVTSQVQLHQATG
jgi:hypothetical protein